jgi:putative addiction module component (TIGR02574 family)
MAIELSSDQLDALTVAEKVRLLEQVWQSLCSQPDSIDSPDWHADVLTERRQRLLDGPATSIPWKEAKVQLQRLAE